MLRDIFFCVCVLMKLLFSMDESQLETASYLKGGDSQVTPLPIHGRHPQGPRWRRAHPPSPVSDPTSPTSGFISFSCAALGRWYYMLCFMAMCVVLDVLRLYSCIISWERLCSVSTITSTLLTCLFDIFRAAGTLRGWGRQPGHPWSTARWLLG